MTEHPTASWEAMQDGMVLYRKQQLYSIQGKLPNLGDYIIAGCRYGGPIGSIIPSADLLKLITRPSSYERYIQANCAGSICASRKERDEGVFCSRRWSCVVYRELLGFICLLCQQNNLYTSGIQGISLDLGGQWMNVWFC